MDVPCHVDHGPNLLPRWLQDWRPHMAVAACLVTWLAWRARAWFHFCVILALGCAWRGARGHAGNGGMGF